MDDDRLTDLGPGGGGGYDAALLERWLDGRARVDAPSWRRLPRGPLPRSLSPIVKPLPAGGFRVHGSNAEMRWEVMRGQGFVVPNADFFGAGTAADPRGQGAGRRDPGVRDERRTAAARSRVPGAGHRAALGRDSEHQVGGPDRGLRHSPGLLLEHPGLPVVRVGLPGPAERSSPPSRSGARSNSTGTRGCPRTRSTCSPGGPGRAAGPSPAPRSAPTAGGTGTRPSRATPAPRPPGNDGSSGGALPVRGHTRCGPGPPT
jgi:hypothetical protein